MDEGYKSIIFGLKSEHLHPPRKKGKNTYISILDYTDKDLTLRQTEGTELFYLLINHKSEYKQYIYYNAKLQSK